jgi:hypothetical protein
MFDVELGAAGTRVPFVVDHQSAKRSRGGFVTAKIEKFSGRFGGRDRRLRHRSGIKDQIAGNSKGFLNRRSQRAQRMRIEFDDFGFTSV